MTKSGTAAAEAGGAFNGRCKRRIGGRLGERIEERIGKTERGGKAKASRAGKKTAALTGASLAGSFAGGSARSFTESSAGSSAGSFGARAKAALTAIFAAGFSMVRVTAFARSFATRAKAALTMIFAAVLPMILTTALAAAAAFGLWGCAEQKVSVSGLSQAARLQLSFERDGERFVIEAELGAGEDAAVRVFRFRFKEPAGIGGMTVTRAAEGGAVMLSMGGPSAEVTSDSPLLLPLRALCPGGAELTGSSRDGSDILLTLRRGDDLYTLQFAAGAERPHKIVYHDATGDITLALEETV